MLWAVPVLPRAYRYYPEHTGPKTKPVLPRTYRYCPEHTNTVQSIPVLPKYFIFQTVLMKTPDLYLVPELKYPCHCCHPYRYPLPRRHSPHHRHHHHHLGSWGNSRGRSSRKPQVSIKSQSWEIWKVEKLCTDRQTDRLTNIVTYTIRWSRIKMKIKPNWCSILSNLIKPFMKPLKP